MSETPGAAASGRKRLRPCMALLAGPLAWLVDLEASYALAHRACGGRVRLALHALSAGGLAVAAGAGVRAGVAWRRARRFPAAGAPGRARFMAAVGLGVSGLAVLLLLAAAVPKLLLAGCE